MFSAALIQYSWIQPTRAITTNTQAHSLFLCFVEQGAKNLLGREPAGCLLQKQEGGSCLNFFSVTKSKLKGLTVASASWVAQCSVPTFPPCCTSVLKTFHKALMEDKVWPLGREPELLQVSWPFGVMHGEGQQTGAVCKGFLLSDGYCTYNIRMLCPHTQL